MARKAITGADLRVRDGCLIALTLLACLYTLAIAGAFILPVLIALIFNLLLQPARRFLAHRLRLPSPLASLLLLLAMVAVFGAIVFAVSLPASTWIARLPESLPLLEKKFAGLRGPLAYLSHGLEQVQQAMATVARPNPQQQTVTIQQSSGLSTQLGGVGLSVLIGTKAALAQIFTVIVLLFFLLSSGDSILRRLVEIMPRFADKRRVIEICNEIERNVSAYLATITVMNGLVGVANGLSAWIFGLPDPLLWGTVAFLLNYIPILGPFTGVVVFFLVGVFSFDHLLWAFAPAGVYLAIHVIEGETVTPMLLASRFTLNPVMVMVSLFFWNFLWGIPGALLSVPLLAVIKIVCDRIELLTPVGHMLGGPPRSLRTDKAPLIPRG